MDFLYFLVKGSEFWEQRFHENFFVTCGGFTTGVIAALIIGAVVACIFYFGCCNSKTSRKSANIGMWALFMVVAGVIGYFYADKVVIGDSSKTDKESMFYKHSFYKANNDYYIAETNKVISDGMAAELKNLESEISGRLDKGGDVRFEYDITTAVLCMLFFFIVSVIVKRFTINGKAIPFMKP